MKAGCTPAASVHSTATATSGSPCFSECYGAPRDLHSFPTRRSSDLQRQECRGFAAQGQGQDGGAQHQDRKSTRLNSSHLGISYAVFFLNKKRSGTPGGSSSATGPTSWERSPRCSSQCSTRRTTRTTC